MYDFDNKICCSQCSIKLQHSFVPNTTINWSYWWVEQLKTSREETAGLCCQQTHNRHTTQHITATSSKVIQLFLFLFLSFLPPVPARLSQQPAAWSRQITQCLSCEWHLHQKVHQGLRGGEQVSKTLSVFFSFPSLFYWKKEKCCRRAHFLFLLCLKCESFLIRASKQKARAVILSSFQEGMRVNGPVLTVRLQSGPLSIHARINFTEKTQRRWAASKCKVCRWHEGRKQTASSEAKAFCV